MEKRCYVCQKIKNIEEFYKVENKIYNICLHDRNRLYCKEHNKKKSRCKECGGRDTNLRPLLSIDNKRKSDKWTEDDEINWEKILSTRVSASLIV